ncbi:MAG TPA: hypothetical protein VK625_22715 [Flavitalea sp.]|nr:hypothetical protein [Flavitalea sp.]
MSYIKGLGQFKTLFFKPRVFAFIFTGVGFMFLTFLTHDNALELSISGIASVFIGIGVNNFTAIETEQKDEQKLRRKTQQAIKTLLLIQRKTKKIKTLTTANPHLISLELGEMNDYIELCIEYLEEA